MIDNDSILIDNSSNYSRFLCIVTAFKMLDIHITVLVYKIMQFIMFYLFMFFIIIIIIIITIIIIII